MSLTLYPGGGVGGGRGGSRIIENSIQFKFCMLSIHINKYTGKRGVWSRVLERGCDELAVLVILFTFFVSEKGAYASTPPRSP